MGERDIPPISANLRSSKMRKDRLFATSLRAVAVRSVQSVTMSQCVLSRQIESPTSSASWMSSADVSTSADRHKFVCLMDINRSRYDARGPVVGSPARTPYVLVRVGCEAIVGGVQGAVAGRLVRCVLTGVCWPRTALYRRVTRAGDNLLVDVGLPSMLYNWDPCGDLRGTARAKERSYEDETTRSAVAIRLP